MTCSKVANGYKSKFAEKVPEDYFCKKCYLVARQITVTSCCGESFCSACIENEKGKPCPQCGSASFSTMELVKYQNRISSLKVFCSMKERGCDWCGSLQLLDSHLDPKLMNCRYVDIQCPLGCLKILPRIIVDQHMITECKKRPCACKLCGFRGTFDEVTTDHISKCEHFPIQCPNLCGQTLKRSEMESHRRVCPREIMECSFSKLGCTKKLKRAEKEEHIVKNHLKHLELAAEAIMNLQNVPQKKDDSQTVKKLEMEIQKMKKRFRKQNKLIKVQNTRLLKLEELVLKHDQGSEKQSKLSGIKRPRLESEPEEVMKSKKKSAGSVTIKSEDPSCPLEENQKPVKIKSEMKLHDVRTGIKSEKKEINSNASFNPLPGEPKDMKILKPTFHARYFSEFTMKNFLKEKAIDKPNKLETPPMYTHEHGYKFSIGIDANGFGSSRGKAMRVWMKSLPGEHDNQLQWPAKVSFQIELIGNKGANNWIVLDTKSWLKPSTTSISCQSFSSKPTDEYVFIDHCKLSNYLSNDALRFRITPAILSTPQVLDLKKC